MEKSSEVVDFYISKILLYLVNFEIYRIRRDISKVGIEGVIKLSTGSEWPRKPFGQ